MKVEPKKNVSVGLLFNSQKSEAIKKAEHLCEWGREVGIDFLLPAAEASALKTGGVSDDTWLGSVKFAVILGGDGTFLRAARYTFGRSIPLYGINLGRLGFLAVGNHDQAEQDILSILSGGYTLQKRHLLKGTIWRGGKKVHEMRALNDFVFTKANVARVIDLEVHVGDELLTYFIGDGLILSTPTGSTAYSLSAGGPIAPPHIPSIILAPICAHSLYARPVVLSDSDVVNVYPLGDDIRNIMLTLDGQLGYDLMPEDRIEVRLDPDVYIHTIQLPGRNYYDLLREKLRWGYNGISMGGEQA